MHFYAALAGGSPYAIWDFKNIQTIDCNNNIFSYKNIYIKNHRAVASFIVRRHVVVSFIVAPLHRRVVVSPRHRAVVSFTVASSSCCHHVVAASLSLSCSSSSPYCLVALFIIAVLLCCSAVVFIVVLSSPRCVCRRLRHVVAVLSCHCLCGIVVHHHIRRVFVFIALFLLHLRLRRVVVHLIFVTLLFYFVFVIFIAPLWWSSSLLSVTRESVVLAVERWPQQQFCM